MPDTVVPIKIRRQGSAYDISIGRDAIESAGAWAGRSLDGKTGKALIISNRKVFGIYGEATLKSFRRAGFQVDNHLIGDGERFKSLRTLEGVLEVLSSRRFTRADSVVALGGGVVGDLAGFAASIYLRGIGFLQIPTTLLAMIDSSVGGKTAVNSSFGKNLIGSFYQPHGVLIDVSTLRTLAKREMTAGFCEAIKQGSIGGRRLFDRTDRFLSTYGGSRRLDFDDPEMSEALAALIADQVRFKAKIVQNDELESAENTSPTSRKILNFGHTLAHALEKATDYRYLRHGEAVGYGVLFASALSKKLALISQDEVDLLNDVVRRAGVLPAISHIDPSKVLQGLEFDKKKIGKSLHWILLNGIGNPVVVPDTDIPRSAISSTLKAIQK